MDLGAGAQQEQEAKLCLSFFKKEKEKHSASPAHRRSVSPAAGAHVKYLPRRDFCRVVTRCPVTALTGQTGSDTDRLQTGPNLNLKNKKNSKNTSSCDESNIVKNFQIFVHLVYFADI